MFSSAPYFRYPQSAFFHLCTKQIVTLLTKSGIIMLQLRFSLYTCSPRARTGTIRKCFGWKPCNKGTTWKTWSQNEC
jgi:hypothetical protein